MSLDGTRWIEARQVRLAGFLHFSRLWRACPAVRPQIPPIPLPLPAAHQSRVDHVRVDADEYRSRDHAAGVVRYGHFPLRQGPPAGSRGNNGRMT